MILIYHKLKGKISPFVFCLIFSLSLSLQGQNHFHRFYLKDKGASPFSLAEPSFFLSQRSIDRRSNQDLPLLSTDLPITPAYIDSFRMLGAKIQTKSKWMNTLVVKNADSVLLSQLEALSFVKDKMLIKRRAKQDRAQWMPSAQSSNRLLSEGADYGWAYGQVSMINTHWLHGLGYWGNGVCIAVIDAGFNKTIEIEAFQHLFDGDLENGEILDHFDFVDRNDSAMFTGSHGTWVLSSMAAYAPGIFIGTAPRASYALYRSEDVGSETWLEEDNWAAAAERADSIGADILNTSLGYTRFDSSIWDYSYADMDGASAFITKAADIAASKGILVVNSAGNSGANAWKYIGAPADGDSVFAVGGVDAQENYASFSSKGPSFDGRVKPNACAQAALPYLLNTAGEIGQANGTSFSSPILAGAAACLWQANPEKNAMEIFRVIEESSSQFTLPDSNLGYGLANFWAAHLILQEKDLQSTETLAEVLGTGIGAQIGFSLPHSGQLWLQIVEAGSGKMWRSCIGDIESHSFYQVPIPIPADLSAGLYLLRLEIDGELFAVGKWFMD